MDQFLIRSDCHVIRSDEHPASFLDGLYHPKVFGHLLGKLIPLTIGADINKSSVSTIRVVGVPTGCFVQPDGSFDQMPSVIEAPSLPGPVENAPAAAAEPAARAVEAEAMPVSIEDQVKAELKSMTAMLDGFIRERT
jgi:hypothetical protein